VFQDELTQLLSFALRFDGRKRVHSAAQVMAQITAEQLVEYLERASYVVMHKPNLAPHSVNLGAEINKAVKTRRVQ
jgi:hypothetical protein